MSGFIYFSRTALSEFPICCKKILFPSTSAAISLIELFRGHDVSRMRQSLSSRGPFNTYSSTIIRTRYINPPQRLCRPFETIARTEDSVTEDNQSTVSLLNIKLTLADISKTSKPLLNAFQFHRRPTRYRPFRISTIFNPNPTDPSPLINDLIRRINRCRTHPR